ncbi:hypothetical protein GCM10010277_74480 [Streptomyces longisporoflavus]|uniref:hypothetical protein n=1 Tax=Streptomyces longisporoflavus TaxID=28044 RepID=UPI00167E07F4|nr:hypothetical protein [Streptomyces longisporoflavus]GGV66588.1 hypothetical protein GCM10010277_74480 [Streptomyces longisporoflavus]
MSDLLGGTVIKALLITGRERRSVSGAAAAACAAALIVGGALVTGAFAVSWGLFLEARRDAESSIEGEESYVAFAGQMNELLKVAFGVFPLLLLVALALVAWLLTAQAVTAAHVAESSTAGPGAGTGAACALNLSALWRRSRPHLGAAFRVQLLTVACALVPGLAGLLVLAAVDMELVPGVTWPTYHEPATVQFLLVGRALPVVIWVLGLVLISRFSLATAVRVADGCPAVTAMRRSWTLTRTARARTAGIFLLCTAAVGVVFLMFKWLGAYVAHWAGLLMLAVTDDNVWVTGVLVLVTPVAVALVLLPLALAPAGVVLACLRERLAHE